MNFETSSALIRPWIFQDNHKGLDRMRTLLRLLGDPQKDLRCIHIAGTNGKGSTAAMLEAILRAAGYHVGLYTSPALRQFNERIRVDGHPAPDEDLEELIGLVGRTAQGLPDLGYELPNEFELVTAVGFMFFARQRCQIVVLEVGLGGILDPTNVIEAPEAAVIAPIGLDHMALLGNTVAEIAAEKAGILKQGSPAVLARQTTEAQTVLEARCRDLGITSHFAAPAVGLSQSLVGQRLAWGGYADLTLSLLGSYQRVNVGTVLETVSVLQSRGWEIPEPAVREGLKSVSWPARLQLLRKDPPVLLDGAHNGHGVAALEQAVTELFGNERLTLVAGMLADKDYPAMLARMTGHAKRLYLVPPPSPRALSGREAEAAARQVFPDAKGFDSVPAGLEAALAAQARDGSPIVCFGSLYLAGEILDYFGRQT